MPCWIGGDLAQLDDLAAVALVFPRDDLLVAFVRCYLPSLVVAGTGAGGPGLSPLGRAAAIWSSPTGSMIDFARIEQDIRDWCQQFEVRDICFDQYGSVQMTGNLFNAGLPARMEPKNPKTFTAPARELETRVRHGRFRHDGNTCLRWQASNVVVSRRMDDSILPKKEGPESPNKIDAIDALLLAVGGWLRAAPVPDPTYSVLVVG